MSRAAVLLSACLLFGFYACDANAQIGITVCQSDGPSHTITAFLGVCEDMDVFSTSVEYSGLTSSGILFFSPERRDATFVVCLRLNGLNSWTVVGFPGAPFWVSINGVPPFQVDMFVCTAPLAVDAAADSPYVNRD